MVRRAIDDEANEVLVSVVTAWEMAIKVGLGKWPETRALLDVFDRAVEDEGFELLPISVAHARLSGLLISPHRDPFDRLLAAQSLTESLTLVTADIRLAALGAQVLW